MNKSDHRPPGAAARDLINQPDTGTAQTGESGGYVGDFNAEMVDPRTASGEKPTDGSLLRCDIERRGLKEFNPARPNRKNGNPDTLISDDLDLSRFEAKAITPEPQ